jgi:FlaA1/EpsC-like NDP-sugar epimerase
MPRIRTLLLLLGDILVSYVTFLANAWAIANSEGFWSYDFTIYVTDERTLPSTAIVCGSIVLGLYFLGLYDELQSTSNRMIIENLMLVMGVTLLIQAIVSYTRTGLEMQRWLMLFGGPLVMLTLTLWRSTYRKLLLVAAGRQRVVLIGNTEVARQVATHILAHPEIGFEVLCCLKRPGESDIEGIKTIPLESDLERQIEALKPELMPSRVRSTWMTGWPGSCSASV